MARDRQRAKQRKARRQPSPPAREDGNAIEGGRDESHRAIHRENVPGPVEHTGDVDQFEAELVAGAEGEPAPDDVDLEREALESDAQEALGREAGDGDDGGGGGGGAVVAPSGGAPAPRGGAAPTESAQGRGAGRFFNFLKACWAELQRVQWPDRRQVGQATAVVLGFVVVAGAFLGVADYFAERLVDLIL